MMNFYRVFYGKVYKIVAANSPEEAISLYEVERLANYEGILPFQAELLEITGMEAPKAPKAPKECEKCKELQAELDNLLIWFKKEKAPEYETVMIEGVEDTDAGKDGTEVRPKVGRVARTITSK